MKGNVNGWGYLIVPRLFTKALGITEATVLSEVLYRENLYKGKGVIGFFPFPTSRMEHLTGLEYYQQHRILKKLEETGLLWMKRMGKDGQRHIRVRENNLIRFCENLRTDPTTETGSKKMAGSATKTPVGSAEIREPTHVLTKYYSLNNYIGTNVPIRSTRIVNGSRIDTRSDSKDSSKDSTRQSPLITFWNNLPHTPKHKTPESKRYKESVRMLRVLKMKGLSRPLDPKFAKENKIPKDYIKRKWSEETIKAGLEDLARLFHPDYFPINKNGLKGKSLAELIYSPYTQTSMFLMVKASPPVMISEKWPESKDPQTQRITKMFKQQVYPKTPSKEAYTLNRLGKEVMEFHKEIKKDLWGEFDQLIPTPYDLAERYTEWLKTKSPLPPIFAILPSGATYWNGFCHWFQKSLGISFKTGKEYHGSSEEN